MQDGEYRVAIRSMRVEASQKKRGETIFVCAFDAPTGRGEWRPRFSQASTFGNIKELMFALLGRRGADVPDDAAEEHRFATAMATAACGSENGKATLERFGIADVGTFVADAEVMLTRATLTTREGGTFTRHQWAPVPEADCDALDAALRAARLPPPPAPWEDAAEPTRSLCEHARVAASAAEHLRVHGVARELLEREALVALICAVDAFDATRGDSLADHARHHVSQHFSEVLKRHRRRRRQLLALPTSKPIATWARHDAADAVTDERRAATVARVLAGLSAADLALIEQARQPAPGSVDVLAW